MENNKNDDVIRLGDIFHVLWKNIILLAAVTAAIFIVGVIYTFGIAKPQYAAEQSFVVVVRDSATGDMGGTPSATVLNTMAGLVTENNVLAPVAEANELTVGALRDMITVGSATNSGLVTVTVECGDSQLAVKLANEVFDSLNEFLADTSIQVYYKCAVVESSPAMEAVYVSPNKVLYLAIFLLGGLVVACIVVYVKEFCSSKFRTKTDVENYLGRKVVGYFVDDKKADRRGAAGRGARSLSLIEPDIRTCEPFNKLFTNIKYSNVDHPYRIIMVTSSQEKELKSSLVGNLACCLAYNNLKVAVLDMDMRKPVQHRLFGVAKDDGVIEYVDGSCALDDIIKPSSRGVDVITAGKKVINPLVIIESEGFKKLVGELSSRYDYIIVDTPPVLACSDAAAVSKLCDGVLFNISMADCKKKKAAAALECLVNVGAHIIGVNVTKAVADKRDDYYYYSDSYYAPEQNEGAPSEGGKEQ